MQLGTFVKTLDGFAGFIRTIKVDLQDVRIVKIDGAKKGENSPDFRVLADGVEVGAAWKKMYEKDKQKKTYLSVQLDDPSLDSPLSGGLFDRPDGKSADLMWSRLKRN